jgi:hypothetical protein
LGQNYLDVPGNFAVCEVNLVPCLVVIACLHLTLCDLESPISRESKDDQCRISILQIARADPAETLTEGLAVFFHPLPLGSAARSF